MPLVYLAFVIGFWVILFFVAIFLTRRALHGVGEPLPEEAGNASPQTAEPARAKASSNGSRTNPNP